MWFYSFELPLADVNTFQIVGDQYAKDKNRVWFYSFELPLADVKTFQVLGAGYSKDKNRVWFDTVELPLPDANTFQVVGGGYSKDKNNVYFNNEIRKGVNPVDCTKEILEIGVVIECHQNDNDLLR